MAAIFFSVILILSLTIEIDPRLAILTYPSFVAVAVCTYTCLAVSNNLTTWESERAERHAHQAEKTGLNAGIKQAKADLKNLNDTIQKLTFERSQLVSDINNETTRLKRLAAKGDTVHTSNDTSAKGNIELVNETRKLKKQDRLNRIIELAKDHSQSEMAEILEVSISTVKRDCKQLNGTIQGAK